MLDMGLVAFDVEARKHAFAAHVDGRDEVGELDNTPEAIERFLARQQARCGRMRAARAPARSWCWRTWRRN